MIRIYSYYRIVEYSFY